MAKEPLRWQPEIISRMTTEAIVKKLKELVSAFDLSSFTAKAQKYLSCEDLSEEEYYPQATFSNTDEDFIWMACEELWKRLIPDRPAVEHVAEQLDNLVEEIIKAGEKQRWKEVFRRSREALDLICRHTIEETSVGRMLRRDFYDKLRRTTFYDFDSLFDDLIKNLVGHEEYERVIDIAEVFGDATGMTDVPVEDRTKLLSDNGAGYISRAFRDYLNLGGIGHIRAAPFHPQTNGKVERYQQSLKREVNQLPYELPSQLERAIADFVNYYNYRRYHKALGNVTPADVLYGGREEILERRKEVHIQTINRRRDYNRGFRKAC